MISFSNAEDRDGFFDDVYKTSHPGEISVSEFKQSPSKIADVFKKFIFHDPEYHKINTNVQNAMQACITTVCNRI